jgi:hypothetical protein
MYNERSSSLPESEGNRKTDAQDLGKQSVIIKMVDAFLGSFRLAGTLVGNVVKVNLAVSEDPRQKWDP